MSEPNGTWARGVETRPSPAQAGSRLRREQRTPRASVDAQPRVRPGRENQPAGPVRHRDRKPVTNDPRGGACNAKEKKCRREASKNRKGARPGRWVPAGQKTPKRDSRRVGNPGDGTARPVNAAGTHERAKPHESRPDEPVNRGGNSTGRRRRLTTSAEAGAVAVVKRQRDASGVEVASQPRPRGASGQADGPAGPRERNAPPPGEPARAQRMHGAGNGERSSTVVSAAIL
jgi:hypothetical protein